MTNLNLTGPQAGLLALGLVAAAVATRFAARGAVRRAAPTRPRWAGAPAYLFEAAVIAALYAAWQWLAGFSHGRLGPAVDRGERLLRWEHDLRLPSEHDVQRLLLPHDWLVQGANLYYAIAHFTGMGLMLLWLFVRHRPRYPDVRTALVLVTAACLAIQFVPVAPPRLLPGAGFVDTAALFGQSVYAPLTPGEVSTLLGVDFGADQLSAMPSVHVAWALLVAIAVQTAAASRWRSLVWLHPAVTVLVIVATANHYWLDGVVAAGLLGLALGAVPGLRKLARFVGPRIRAGTEVTPTPRGA